MVTKLGDVTISLDITQKVMELLGKDRLAALGSQPLAINAGGIDSVMQTACSQCAGYPDPVRSAAIRTVQLCGSLPTKQDLGEDVNTSETPVSK